MNDDNYDKSHVSMEQNQCFICGTVQDTGAILLDTRLRASMKPKTLTGYAPCDVCKGHLNNGFLAMVEAKAPSQGRNMLRADEAFRTGKIMWIRREAFTYMFDRPDPVGEDGKPLAMVYVQEGVLDQVQAAVHGPEADEENGNG